MHGTLGQVRDKQGLVGRMEEVRRRQHAPPSSSAALVVVHCRFELTRTTTAATRDPSSVHLVSVIVVGLFHLLQPALGQPGATQHRQLRGTAGGSTNQPTNHPLFLFA